MSIPTYAELRRAVDEAAEPIEHPTKGPDAKYGKVVYVEGGEVIVKVDDTYLSAKGEDHAESVWALAYKLRLTSYDPAVAVKQITRDEFVKRATGA
jgi:hypothetical protein